MLLFTSRESCVSPYRMILTWTPHHSPITGNGLLLTGLPAADSASVYFGFGDGRFVAHAFIGGHYLNHRAGTRDAARKRLEKEIDRRSIGLLKVDVVEFEGP